MKKKTLIFTLILIIAIVLIIVLATKAPQDKEENNITEHETIEGIVHKDKIMETNNENGEITTNDLKNLLNEIK